jgi:FKBP-type peptidyl-prolyl cis-trans isomerase
MSRPLLLIVCCLSVVASLVPAARPVSTRRNALATAAAAAAGVLAVRPATAEDVKVKAASVGVTPGGVKFFDKVTADTCSPFNPCSPQAGDIVKIKYKSYLSNGQMYDSSEGPGRKPVAMKFKADPPAMIKGWEEAIDGMKMGQTRVIQVPANMAYGDKGGAACSKRAPPAICARRGWPLAPAAVPGCSALAGRT